MSMEGSLMYTHVIEHNLLSTRDKGAGTESAHLPLTLNLCDFLHSLKVAQLCPTLCNLHTVHGRTLEWVAYPFSRGPSQPGDLTQVSRIAGRFFTSWATREAQECWSGWPILSPGDLPDPGIELGSPAPQADSERLTWMKSVPAPSSLLTDGDSSPQSRRSGPFTDAQALLFPSQACLFTFLFSLLMAHLGHYHWEVVDRHYSSSKE